MDLAVNDKPVGTIFIQLFNETVPITAENFRLLATGNVHSRVYHQVWSELHEIFQYIDYYEKWHYWWNYFIKTIGDLGFGYKGSTFHRIIPGFVMQGGDFTSNGRGDGQMSIYGQKFEDENFLVKHDSLGTSMSKEYHYSYWYIIYYN